MCTKFDPKYGNRALRVLKYLNCLHELCVTATAAAPTVDHADKWAKSSFQTITNFRLFLEHQHAPVPFTFTVSLTHISPSCTPLWRGALQLENLCYREVPSVSAVIQIDLNLEIHLSKHWKSRDNVLAPSNTFSITSSTHKGAIWTLTLIVH